MHQKNSTWVNQELIYVIMKLRKYSASILDVPGNKAEQGMFNKEYVMWTLPNVALFLTVQYNT
jgi:hypothetical protein